MLTSVLVTLVNIDQKEKEIFGSCTSNVLKFEKLIIFCFYFLTSSL